MKVRKQLWHKNEAMKSERQLSCASRHTPCSAAGAAESRLRASPDISRLGQITKQWKTREADHIRQRLIKNVYAMEDVQVVNATVGEIID